MPVDRTNLGAPGTIPTQASIYAPPPPVKAKPAPSTYMGPRAGPLVKDTRPPIQAKPYFVGQKPATHSSTGTPIFFRPDTQAPTQPTRDDLIWQAALKGGLAKPLAQAPKLSPAITVPATVAGSLLPGVSSVQDLLGGHGARAAADAAFFLPVFKGPKALVELIRGVRAARGAGEGAAALEAATTGERAAAVTVKATAPAAARRTVEMTDQQAAARLAHLDKEYEKLVGRFEPAVHPYTPEVVKAETQSRNTMRGRMAQGKKPMTGKATPEGRTGGESATIKTVGQEVRSLAEQKILDTVAAHPDHPFAKSVVALMNERDALRAAVTGRGEAGIFGTAAPSLPHIAVREGSPPLPGERPGSLPGWTPQGQIFPRPPAPGRYPKAPGEPATLFPGNVPGIEGTPLSPQGEVFPAHEPAPPNPLRRGPIPGEPPRLPRGAETPETGGQLGRQVREALQSAPAVRREQEALRGPFRAARAARLARANEIGGREGHLAGLAAMKGTEPTVHYSGFEGFTPEQVDTLVRFAQQHPGLAAHEQRNAAAAIYNAAEGSAPRPFEQRLLERVFGAQGAAKLGQTSNYQKMRQGFLDVANVPRAVMASADVSGAGRQALLMATSHPAMWSRNLGPMFHALTSNDYYLARMAELHADPFVQMYADRMGFDMTEMSAKGSTKLREEPFATPLADKIPGVRMSGRAFMYFLNKSRVDLAKYLHARAVAQGLGEDPHMLESIGSVVNSETGRGDLGQGVIGKSADGINLLFFSPRLIKSRVDFLNPFWYKGLHPIARHEAYRAVGGLAVLMTTALSIAHEAGAQVNMDPRSSDFAKIKVGNTRIDLAGGFQQYIRLLAELATQQTVSSSGKVTGLAPFRAKPAIGGTSDMTIFLRFLRNKLAPVVSGAVDVGTGADAVGNPISLKNTLLPRVVPLAAQDAVSVGRDAAKSTGSPAAGVFAGLGAFGLSGFGTGVQNFTPKVKKQRGTITGSSYAPRSGGSRSKYAPSGSSFP